LAGEVTATRDADSRNALSGRTLILVASLAFVSASIVNSLLHEAAHTVAGLPQGLTPTISPFSVSYDPEGTARQQIITSAAGPLFSLTLGLILLVVARRWGTGFVRLFFFWLPFMGIMNFVGYCLIAPFGQAGDTGKMLALLNAPGPSFVAVALTGVIGQFLLAWRFAVEVKRYTSSKTEERQLAYFPWLIGTPAVMVLTLLELIMLRIPGLQLVLILAYSVAFGIFAPMQFIFSSRVSNTYEALGLSRSLTLPFAVTVAFALLDLALAAVGGLQLG